MESGTTSGSTTVRLGTAGAPRFRLDGGGANMWVGGNGDDGDLLVFAAGGDNKSIANATVHINGGAGDIRLGGNGTHGDMTFQATDGRNRIRLNAGTGDIRLGGNGARGDLLMFTQDGDNQSSSKATVHISGGNADVRLGGNDRNGDITLQATDGSNRIRLKAGAGNIWLGGNGANGDLLIFDSKGDNATPANAAIHLKASDGDIILRNADCAEEFDLKSDVAEPGSVMVLDDEGRLEPSCTPYDKRVAGVISGAGDYRPGIVLDRREADGPRAAIALAGKAYCKVDAQYGAIEPGDLLTTSSTPGHAMKASDPQRAFGTVIGKALRPLSGGTGLIPVLVALQ